MWQAMMCLMAFMRFMPNDAQSVCLKAMPKGVC
ncbi:hypothetical protein E9M_03709 [Moraxella catarrhalis 46P47B1]|nr:hypothetical protein E9G_02213 [Moraxella catarrhalis 7169]EGE13574.1 hypothetical protein E9M_03709 [Moraxella catarrhalis 46P47B1]EGE13687.1 hypothetical protein E9O_08839 [Moraxella catarrhalis 12P80B1]EGE16122.1 hypothetical protein E9K_02551 [Moraxella catarrhalis 103P14B1]EGE18974.1 hypothetical protein E9Q_02683 [Moraxella catarrhalis BC1]EGE19266.1 hypothetical protein E9S_06815 [Moraxella catarrhalis BC7]EGE21883.1 hypothetical protein E9U_01491 [Moraxella catarrhalis BC8]EGE2531